MGPLKGVRVLDLTRLLPGPLCTQYLTRLGATVIKLEAVPGIATGAGVGGGTTSDGSISTSGNVDYVRSMPPLVKPLDPSRGGEGNISSSPKKHGALFEALNCGKLGLSIDMKSEKGMAILKRLIPTIDVVVESSRPGVMDRMGFGYEDLKKINPALVYCSISGYGATGPYSLRAGHDMNYMALAGNLSITGPPVESSSSSSSSSSSTRAPDTLGFQAADVTGSLNGVIGVLSALLERKVTGMGQFVDVSMTEAAMSLALPALQYGLLENPNPSDVPKRGQGILDGGMPNYRIYACKDDKLLSVGALEMHFWYKICKAVEIEPDSLDTIEKVDALFKSKTQMEWMDLLKPLDACVEPVLEMQEVFSHPQHVARKVAFPADNSMGLPRQIVFGPKLSNHSETLERLTPAPSIGQHTAEVLRAIPDLTDSELAELLSTKAVHLDTHRGRVTQTAPYKTKVEAGKAYFYCTCGLSEKQPFCDGKHKTTLFRPKKVVAEVDGDVFFCGCRLSKKGSFCDGSHKKLINHDTNANTKPKPN